MCFKNSDACLASRRNSAMECRAQRRTCLPFDFQGRCVVPYSCNNHIPNNLLLLQQDHRSTVALDDAVVVRARVHKRMRVAL